MLLLCFNKRNKTLKSAWLDNGTQQYISRSIHNARTSNSATTDIELQAKTATVQVLETFGFAQLRPAQLQVSDFYQLFREFEKHEIRFQRSPSSRNATVF
jgi:16S rRNA A1518/A1519 N6-dimethyltransferase RsmA/KsgA/DIM1 with predicted DNA glycosylase/AP lyase activity